MPTQKKHIYRVHYTFGYRELIFAKSLVIEPFYDLVISDIDKAERHNLNVQLSNEGNISTYIYYNIQKDIYETEITVTKQLTSLTAIEDILSAYQACNWKCETIKQDIEDLKSFIDEKTLTP